MKRSWKRIVMVLHCMCILGGQSFVMAAPCEPRNPIFGWVPHEEEYVLVTEQAGKYDYIHMPSVRKIDEGNHVCYYAEGLQWLEGERQEDNQCIPADWAFDWYPGGKLYYRLSPERAVEIPLLSDEEIDRIIHEKGENVYDTVYQGRLYEIFKEIYRLVEGKGF